MFVIRNKFCDSVQKIVGRAKEVIFSGLMFALVKNEIAVPLKNASNSSELPEKSSDVQAYQAMVVHSKYEEQTSGSRILNSKLL